MKIVFILQVTPPLFYQLFQVLAERGTYVFPIFYALLPNKSQQTYTRLFQLIFDLRPDMLPDAISVDFELAIWNAARTVWPGISISGCLFHLHQAFVRKISAEGLFLVALTNQDFRLTNCLPKRC